MDSYTKLARKTIEAYIRDHRVIGVPDDVSQDMREKKSGVFVTIFSGEELRGCIGTYLPTQNNIAEEIVSNAVQACSRDYRFFPITADELPSLRYEVSVLSEPERVINLSSHDPKKHGIIVMMKDGRSGLLLPDLEGVDTTKQQIAIASEKGGINVNTEQPELYEFTVEKHI